MVLFKNCLFNYTHQHTHIYVLFKKSKIYIKALKTLLHVSTIRSSSGSILCSLLKLQFKTLSYLLRYVSLVLWQYVVFLCVSRTVFGMNLVMAVRRMLCMKNIVRNVILHVSIFRPMY